RTVASELLSRALQEDPPGGRAMVEGEHVGTLYLVRLVAFARYHHRITGFGPMQRRADRPGAVGLDRIPAGAGTGLAHADDDLVDDPLRPLRPWVVGGHPDAVRETGGDAAHDRALPAITVAAAAEDHAQPSPGELARRGQHALEGVGGVGVVHDDKERLTGPHLLETAGHGTDRRERAADRGGLEAERQARGDGAQEAHHAVLTDQRRGQRQPTGGRARWPPKPPYARGLAHRTHLGAFAEPEGQHGEAEAIDHRPP